MLHVVFGSHGIAVRDAAFALCEAQQAQGAELHRLEASDYTVGRLGEALGSQSLFGVPAVYLLDTPSDAPEFWAELASLADALAATDTTFVVIEGPLLAGPKKLLTQAGAQLQEFKADAVERFNIFSLTEAFARKDKRTLWMLLCEARQAGAAAEEIIGTLWWQIKTLRIAAITTSAGEAGIKEYPYKKAQQALRNFQPGELERLSRTLLTLYHQGHGGEVDIDLALEQWVLRM